MIVLLLSRVFKSQIIQFQSLDALNKYLEFKDQLTLDMALTWPSKILIGLIVNKSQMFIKPSNLPVANKLPAYLPPLLKFKQVAPPSKIFSRFSGLSKLKGSIYKIIYLTYLVNI